MAKFRAARRLWARLMRERFGAEDPRSWRLRFHTQTAGVTLTATQPENNVVRVALEALAAVLGGTQSLHANAMDEALSLPTVKAALLALRTQQILAHETGVSHTVDPVGGAYAVEALTGEVEAQAEAYLARIDRRGGTLKALETGYIQREIAREAYRHQREVEAGRRTIVGVNAFQEEGAAEVPITRIDPALEEKQVRRVQDVRRRRDARRAEGALQSLREGAEEGANLTPLVLEAARHRATLGEISDALRQVYGEFRPLREY